MKLDENKTAVNTEEISEIKNAIGDLPENAKKNFLNGINFYRAGYFAGLAEKFQNDTGNEITA